MQGTLYPDVIESCPPPGSGRKHSHTIKSHHNVGGLPKDLKFTLIEPLRELFKARRRPRRRWPPHVTRGYMTLLAQCGRTLCAATASVHRATSIDARYAACWVRGLEGALCCRGLQPCRAMVTLC